MKFAKKIFLFIMIFIFTIRAKAFDFEINSDKVIIINTSDNITLFEKNSNDKTSIASLTKIITAITVLDNVDSLNDEVTITYNMLTGLDGYAKVGFKVGDKVTVEELLYALMLPSGADAAQALAIYTSGSLDGFVVLMNEEIEKIGVSNSHFSNPVGMDDESNYSCAKDLSIILKYSLNNEVFKEIFESSEFYIKALRKNVKKTTVNTSNLYNLDTSMIKGSKTGWTTDAGMCLSSTATLNGTDYILIVLNAKENSLDHFTDTINIYNYYKNHYGYKTIIEKGDLLYTLDVKDSKQKSYEILSQEDVTLYLENVVSKDNVKISFTGIEYIDNKFKLGDYLGTINVSYEDNLIYSVDVYLNENIKFYNYKLYIFMGCGLALLITLAFIIKIKKH